MKKTYTVLSLILVMVCMFVTTACHAIASEITIAHLSDIHIDVNSKDRSVRKLAQTLPLFQQTVTKINELNPDVVIFTGDSVNIPLESNFNAFLNATKNLKPKYYTAFGNHDVSVLSKMSKANVAKKLGQPAPYYYVIDGDFIFIFLDGTNDKIITANGYFPKEQLEFLDKTLSEHPDKYAIIAEHFPLMPPVVSKTHLILNANDYFKVLDKHKNVIAVLSGHYHMSAIRERNNVLYINSPSMVECPHAFRLLDFKINKKELTMTSKVFYMSDDTKGCELQYGTAKDNDIVKKITLP